MARECLGLIDQLSHIIGRDRRARACLVDLISRTLSCHAMCLSKPALSARSTDSRDAVILAGKMARVQPPGGDPRAHRDLDFNVDSPLSNFLPSGSMSFTLKISSNSTPAMLLTLVQTSLLKCWWEKG